MAADQSDADHAHEYCQDIVVFNDEREASSLRSTFEELMEGEGGGGGGRVAFWNFDMLSFDHLVNLSICNVKLTEIAFIRGCTLLKTLNVSFNKIRDVAPLGFLTQLVHLDISHNKVIDISAVKDLSQLQIFRFHKNNVKCVESLNSLGNLHELWMSNNSITWTEFIHFSKLHNFSHVVIEGNPCEEKPKYAQLLLAICPSILTINGQPAINFVPKPTHGNNKNWYNPSEFLKTTDGRVMLTQAKALLNESQREFVGTHAIGDASVRHYLFDHTAKDSPGSGVVRESDARSVALSQDHYTSTQSANQGQFRATRSEGGDPIKYYKARRHKNVTKKFVQEYDKEVQGGEQDKGDGQYSAHLRAESGPDYSAVDVERTRAQLLAAPVTLLRFGETSSAAVAVSLHEDGTGYARWSHNGSVACSFENNRLFGQFRNGAIAAVVDPGGNGTVMNPRGKCVLNLRVPDKSVGDDSGGGAGEAVAEVLSEVNGSVLHLYEKGGVTEVSKKHEWDFQNLLIAFDPFAWELSVTVTNSRSVSCFSSKLGGRLVKEISQKKKDRSGGKGGSGSQSGGKMSSVSAGGPVLNTEGHESMRSGLASVMSTLDDMLEGMKKK